MTMGTTPGLAMTPTLPMSLGMMVAMMLPGAVPAIARQARAGESGFAAPRFAATYIGIWALAAGALWLVYRPIGAVPGAVLVVGAGLYELSPLKRACRRRCRASGRSGLHFSVCCIGSSTGLMLVLVAVDLMSVPLMIVIAAIALAQKLLPPNPAVDLPVALAIIATGIAAAKT